MMHLNKLMHVKCLLAQSLRLVLLVWYRPHSTTAWGGPEAGPWSLTSEGWDQDWNLRIHVSKALALLSAPPSHRHFGGAYLDQY